MQAAKQDQIFRKWIKQHKAVIFKILHAYCARQQDREDLFQEIALQLWNSIPKFRSEAKEITWIYRVALNTAMQWDRKEKRRLSPLTHLEIEHYLLPGNDHRYNEDVAWLYTEIRQMGDIDRVLILLYLDGVSYQEITEILGISNSNVGVKLNRIKKKLLRRSEVES